MHEPSVASDPAIAERYEVGELLGAGGFAKVYRGRQRATGREVALKVLELDRGPYAAEAAVQLERFRREARFANLNHPNIVPMIEAGETASGHPYLVLAYIPGQDLSEVLASDGQLEPGEALHLMRQVLDALRCAHERGIVHRDLKPENIRITAGSGSHAGRHALLFDFGISAFAPDYVTADEDRRLTDRGEYVGTPAYSAPEQLRGEPPTVLSDLYSWGLIFIECLTGRPAIYAKGPHEAIHVQLSPTPIRLPEALRGHELGELLGRATQKKVDRRQVQASGLMRSLQLIDPHTLPPRSVFALVGLTPERGSEAYATSSAWQIGQVWRVPFARNASFTGRDAMLENIADTFASTERLATVALHGLGGVGKSHLALEYAYSRSDRYRVVAWLRAERTETLAADYIALGEALGLPQTPDQRQRIEDVQNWLERNGRWLLVFDNAPKPAAIRDFLPRLHSGHVLVTSRHSSWKDLTSSLNVDVLEPRESIQFLTKRSGLADETTAAELGEELGRLPLALEEAAAYMETTGRSMRSYLTLLRTQRRRLLFGEDTTGEVRPTLRTTWELSFRQIALEAPAASDLLNLCSFLAPDDISLSLLKRGGNVLPERLRPLASDELALDRTIATLRRYSLIKAEAEALSIHRLVQLATRERLAPDVHEAWALAALALVEAAYPRHTTAGEYRPESGRFMPHAQIVLEHKYRDPSAAGLRARLRRRVGVYASTRGSQLEAWDNLELALSELEAEPVPDTFQISTGHWELGMVLYALGEAHAALDLLQRGLSILPDGPNSAFVGSQLHLALAWVQRTLGDFGATCEAAEQAHASLVAAVGEGHHLTQMTHALRGRGLLGLGRVREARLALDNALAALRTTKHPRHALNCGSLYNIAQLQYDFGEFEAAADSAARALDIGLSTYGRDHPFVSTSQAVLGAARLRLGDLDGALEHCSRALESGQRACRHLHEDIAVSRAHLAERLRRVGQRATAREELAYVLEELPRLCGDTARVAWFARLSLARLAFDRGELEKAREECDAAMAVFEGRYSRSHPGRLEGLYVSATIAYAGGETARADAEVREAKRLAEEAGVSSHPDARACAELGRTLADASRELLTRKGVLHARKLLGEAGAAARRLLRRG